MSGVLCWNSLPDLVVESNSINSFKNNLDKFWQNEDVKFNWKGKPTQLVPEAVV